MEKKQSFTGRARRKQNRWGVKASDSCARVCITVGGIGTILAVSSVFLCLLWVVWPLFESATLTDAEERSSNWADKAVAVGIDDYRVLLWGILPDGKVPRYQYSTGDFLGEEQAFTEGQLTAVSRGMDGKSVVLGFEDGTVRVGNIGPRAEFPEPESIPANLRELLPGEQASYSGGVLERTTQGDLRLQRMQVALSEPVQVAEGAISRLDHVLKEGDNPAYCLLLTTGDGKTLLCDLDQKVNQLTEEITWRARKFELPPDDRDQPSAPPDFLALGALGTTAYIAWEDGLLYRYNTRSRKAMALEERTKVVPEPGVRLTQMQMLLGRTTLVTGDSSGQTSGWFVLADPPRKLVRAHTLEGPAAEVTALGSSATTRMLSVGYSSGEVRVFYMTTASELVRSEVPSAGSIQHVLLAPKNDALVAFTPEHVWRAAFYPGYPEASPTALFRPLWYENAVGPEHVWQSGGGSEDLEPKLGLMPLIFGTIKATTYSMLFGAPLALLAAIYTSEFMHPKLRSRIKPLIESMASLPSVVLGFLAGLILAPLLEPVVPSLLAMFVTVPLALLIGAQLWQLLPQDIAVRSGSVRLPLFLLAVPLGVAGAWQLGPLLERLLFDGNIRQWLSSHEGSPLGGWLLATFPLSALAITLGVGGFLNPWLRGKSSYFNRRQASLLSLTKFCSGLLLSVLLALCLASLLSWVGADSRGIYLGKYDSRNTLIVGIVMGFAIIPIIYTIADDALTTVPQHLRNGSYGCGATRWQTAVRIVIPTAMSGLFSALMIGLGRAVGETMIMLMASGNTPVMEWNIFSGMRTLSANIATELPEAAKNSAHFRTLFLTALVLFLLTFVVNTAAELVRIRFRRRAYQL